MDVKEIRQSLGLSQAKFGIKFHIPPANVSLRETGTHNPPDYVVYMMQKIIQLESELNELKEGKTDEEVSARVWW